MADTLCIIDATPIIGSFMLSKFKFTGRLSFSITIFYRVCFERDKADVDYNL
jgi:hypothetical protein